MELPKDAKGEILRLQVDNAIYRKAIDDWCERYRALRRMQVAPSDPVAVHWTIKQLLELDSSTPQG